MIITIDTEKAEQQGFLLFRHSCSESGCKRIPASWDELPCGWISVTDGLPDDNELVLAYFPDMKGSCCDIQISKGWAINKFVSHWLPLPEPPQEENNAIK